MASHEGLPHKIHEPHKFSSKKDEWNIIFVVEPHGLPQFSQGNDSCNRLYAISQSINYLI